MSRSYLPKALRRKIVTAARNRCGYCLTAQEYSGAQLQIEHIVPLTKGGSNKEENLWLACSWCNSYKGTQIDGVDPLSGEIAQLFNPRQQNWFEHFSWSDDGTKIIGKTPTGRVTVDVLQLNNEFIIPARRRWVSAGWHPPSD